jgi:hypothetical protein
LLSPAAVPGARKRPTVRGKDGAQRQQAGARAL